MNALVIFAKYPEPGEVKTKIGSVIGMDESAKLVRCCIKDLVDKNSDEDYDLYLSFIGQKYKEKYRELFPDAILYVQRGKSMGENLMLTFEDLLDDYEKVILIGCDAPQVGPDLIKAALKALESYDVVIGPASDGGYYLLGMKSYHKLFTDLPWGEPTLLDETVKKLQESGHTFIFLDELTDIDNIDELKLAKKNLRREQAPETFDFLQGIHISD
jgi:hypothetical protein